MIAGNAYDPSLIYSHELLIHTKDLEGTRWEKLTELLGSSEAVLTFRGAGVDEIECFKSIPSEPGFVVWLTNLSDY